MIRIHMLDGEIIEVKEETTLVGIMNALRTDGPGGDIFYLKQTYIGNLQGDYEKEGSALATSDERLGITGFLLSHDAFSLDDHPGATIYFASAVKSVSID